MKTLVTGATGFIGAAMCARLEREALPFIGTTRQTSTIPTNANIASMGDINGQTDWRNALCGVEQVVHLAGRAHIRSVNTDDPMREFRRVNVDGTIALARQAATCGVRRFLFVSSIKVNGESTIENHPFTADDAPLPVDPYGRSKHEAEIALHQIAQKTGMEVVIVRPPLVYGPGVKANFGAMIRWLSHGIPLPLAAVTHNRRSFIALDNLVDLLMTCLSHPAAAGQTFLASDDYDMSTEELLRRMGLALGTPARLFHIPAATLELWASAFGKHDTYQRLCGSLQVDIAKTRDVLGWSPPVTVDEGLRRAAGSIWKK